MHEFLQKVSATVNSDRGKQYGPHEVNHARTALVWTAYLGVPVSPRDVCNLNILQKVSRDRFLPKEDNLMDTAGYAANASVVSHETGVAEFIADSLRESSISAQARLAIDDLGRSWEERDDEDEEDFTDEGPQKEYEAYHDGWCHTVQEEDVDWENERVWLEDRWVPFDELEDGCIFEAD